MLIGIPNEVEKYMEFENGKAVIVADAPENIKNKAREINEISLKRKGKPFFKEIK